MESLRFLEWGTGNLKRQGVQIKKHMFESEGPPPSYIFLLGSDDSPKDPTLSKGGRVLSPRVATPMGTCRLCRFPSPPISGCS